MWMTFCEYATVHPDGTMTIVRSGLCEWKLQAFPVVLNIWTAAHLPAHTLSNGQYPLSLAVANDAQEQIWKLDGILAVRNEALPINFVLPTTVSLPSPGKYRAVLHVGALDTEWGFELMPESASERSPS